VERTHDDVPAGIYGIKLSADGSTIFVNFNVHAADKIRTAGMKTKTFGLTAFARDSHPTRGTVRKAFRAATHV